MQTPDARETARRLGALEALEEAGLAVIWRDELHALRAQAREAERLHEELRLLRAEIDRTYQGEPLK